MVMMLRLKTIPGRYRRVLMIGYLLFEKNLRNGGQLTGKTLWANIIIDGGGGKIITAYPSSAPRGCT
ncbi:hypothetical protein AWB94_10810 [Mycolicibacterium canariasense]|nr:hypothetical protein AWB94_10810 [Mycolicibacterium canariasense]